jgi:AraC-like DNA-binding protein
VYEERSSRLDGAVVWTRTATDAEHRVVPDGCMDVVWSDGTLMVAGPDTRAHLVTGTPGTQYTGLRFAPGAGPSILGVPASELRDSRAPLESVWAPAQVRRLAEQVESAPDPAHVLEAAATDRLRDTDAPSPMLVVIVRALDAGRPVAELADTLGISERQLHRRCLHAFGYGPKTLTRVLRMRRAVQLAGSGVSFADTAARSGYADQAHLARDVKALAGVPLRGLIR